jgi:SAM-dependent methyltransferase
MAEAPKPTFKPGPAGNFPDWQELYRSNDVASMPWYTPELDADLDAALRERGASSGSFLDIGTGPGTQAVQLAQRGFTVTGIDLAESAIAKARELSPEVRWRQEDILHPRLDEAFDFVFDRGCFHVLEPADRPAYVTHLKRLVRGGGTVFLKCFSVDQPMRPDGGGPRRLSHQDIREVFGADFDVEQIRDTVYQGTLEVFPRALFVVMRPKP